MTQKASFLVHALEKLGAPLMEAVVSVGEAVNDPEQDGKEAGKVAELVSRATQVSIELAKNLEIKDEDAQSDAIRMALAGIASPLVAHYYTLTQSVPGDAEIQKIIKALQAVLIFADKFSVTPSEVGRLEQIHTGMFSDETQLGVQYIYAMTPSINAVARFSFGKESEALIQDVSSRLSDRVSKLLPSILSAGADEFQTKQVELTLLRSLSELYAACHNEQTELLEKSKDPGQQSIDSVWSQFELRVSMLDALTKGIAGAPAGSSAPVPKASAPAAAPQAAPPATPPATPSEPAAAPVAPAAPPPAGEGASPFSSFKKEDAAPAAAPQAAPPPPPPAEPVATSPADPSPVTPPPATPAEAAVKALEDSEGAEPSPEAPAAGASPFSSFAKKPADSDDE